jgi:NIMA (never in mitosis gene a)-related kinase
MEYADDGNLSMKIKEKKKSGGVFTEDEILNYFTQICLALKHCHDRKILHRDLKAENVFLTRKGLCKLGDFGISKVLSGTRSRAMSIVGTPYYLSPEILNNNPYNMKTDIWALGVLLYELTALSRPFNANDFVTIGIRIT